MLPPLPLTRPASRHSGRVCASSGTWRGKTLSLSGDFAEGKLDRLPALAAELVRLKVDVIVAQSVRQQTRRRQGSDCHDSHCHGAGWRSCWKRVRRQPCATWREHYWIVNPCPGAKRKTTGASEGDRSQALARGRLRDFNQPGQRTSVKRNGTRRKAHSECSFNT